MTDSAFARIRRVVEEALERPPAERVAQVEAALSGEPEALLEALRLLEGVAASEGFLTPPKPSDLQAAMGASSTGAAERAAGTRIGHYLVKHVIASGGMGTVYEAEQESPRRKVALKMIHPQLATPSALRRFRVEAEILAHLRHPHVAQIYEAGVHREGEGPLARELQWFALEYVEGARTLTEWARDAEPALETVLDLFVKACLAVHHAHQRGVIHRDLKPSNLLVDQDGEPKVIDFGVARSTDPDALHERLQTATGDIVGTLQYMSPEQLAGDPSLIDVRCDVYALGMMLYELLCGRLPYDVSGISLAEAARVVQEVPPDRPLAHAPDLPPELEWILLRALEKEPDARYASALDLAQELLRFRANEPVVAGPPSAIYRMRKFGRRHRFGVATAAVAVVTLLAWTLQSNRLRGMAQAEAKRAAYVNEVLRDTLVLGNPYAFEEGGNVDLRVVDLLHSKAAAVTESLVEFPDAAAELRREIGGALLDLGDVREAIPHLEFAAGEHAERLGELHSLTIDTEIQLATALRRSGELDAAEERIADISARVDRTPELPPEIRLALSVNRVRLSTSRGDSEGAIVLARVVLSESERELGRAHPLTQGVLWALGDALLEAGHPAEASPILREVLDARPANERDAPALLVAWQRYAIASWKSGHLARAEEILRDGLRRSERVLGADHDLSLKGASILAAVLVQRSAMQEAEQLLRDVVGRRRALHGETTELLLDEGHLAAVLLSRGALTEARAACERVLAATGEGGALTAPARYANRILVEVDLALGDLPGARRALEDLLVEREAVLGDMDHGRLRTLELEARLLYEEGRGPEAYGRFLELARTELGPHHRLVLDAGRKHARMLATHQRFDAALEGYAAVLRAFAGAAPGVRPEVAWVEEERAAVLVAMGRLEEADQALVHASARSAEELGAQHMGSLRLAARLASVRIRRGELDSAEEILERALATQESDFPSHASDRLSMLADLARIHRARSEFRRDLGAIRSALGPALSHYGGEHPQTRELVQGLELCLEGAGERLDAGGLSWSRLLRDLDATCTDLRGRLSPRCTTAGRAILRVHANVLELLAEPELAEQALREAAECAELLAAGSEERIGALDRHALGLERLGLWAEAEAVRARIVREDATLGEAADRARLRREHARVLGRLDRHEEADLLLQEGLRLLDEAGEVGDTQAAYIEAAAALYEAWGWTEAAAGCRTLLDAR